MTRYEDILFCPICGAAVVRVERVGHPNWGNAAFRIFCMIDTHVTDVVDYEDEE